MGDRDYLVGCIQDGTTAHAWATHQLRSCGRCFSKPKTPRASEPIAFQINPAALSTYPILYTRGVP